MKTTLMVAAMVWAGVAAAGPKEDAAAARADVERQVGFVPEYMKAVPDLAMPGLWQEMKALEVSGDTALPCKVKELIGLAVASQIPCKGCVYGHTRIARVGGATDAEIGEAVAVAGLTRHWSTFFNGVQLDETKFRAEIKQLTDNVKKAMASGQQPPPPMVLTDAKSVMKEVEMSYGFVPEFLKRFPEGSVAGAWRQERDVEMGETALSSKYKSLIGLAVSSQVPCKYCIVADTEFAKLDGATDQEIAEAIAMGSLTRNWAALLDGMQVDEAALKRDYDKIAKALTAKNGKPVAKAK
jgi:AhpD family alkylhydroperoxidase